jgi:hypothetical protein
VLRWVSIGFFNSFNFDLLFGRSIVERCFVCSPREARGCTEDLGYGGLRLRTVGACDNFEA